jgi:hypothetical protein
MGWVAYFMNRQMMYSYALAPIYGLHRFMGIRQLRGSPGETNHSGSRTIVNVADFERQADVVTFTKSVNRSPDGIDNLRGYSTAIPHNF